MHFLLLIVGIFFTQALTSLQMYLKNEKLPYFLYPNYNLFHSLNPKECEKLSNCIKGIIKHLSLDHTALYEVFKLPNELM